MRPMVINQGSIHHRSYVCCFPPESTAGRGGDWHGNSQYSWSQKQISKWTCKSKRRVCFGYSKKTSQDNLRGVPRPTSAGVMWALGRRRWHHSRLLSGSCSTASAGHQSSTRTLPTSSVKGQVHTLLLDRRLRSYPASALLLMRIWTSTGLPEPHPDEHEPFNETGSPLSAGVSSVLPFQCSSSLLVPQAKIQGSLESQHAVSSALSNPPPRPHWLYLLYAAI